MPIKSNGGRLNGVAEQEGWSETVWFQRGFRMVSERFQSGFRGV